MQIFHKKEIREQLIEAKQLAHKNGREIDYILLTQKDWERLRKELGLHRHTRGMIKQFLGMEIRILDEHVTDEELLEATNICRDAPVQINFAELRGIYKRLGGHGISALSIDPKTIPQENRKEFLSEIDKLLLASLKRESV